MGAERECIEYGNSPDCVTYADEVGHKLDNKPGYTMTYSGGYGVPAIDPDTLKAGIEENKKILANELDEILSILEDPKYFSREEIIDLIGDSIKEEVEEFFNLEEIYQHIINGAITALAGVLLSRIPWAKALKILKKIKDKLFKRKKSKEKRESIYGGLIFSGYIGGINGNDHSEIKYKKVDALLNEIKSNIKVSANVEKYGTHIPSMMETLNEHMKNSLDSITTRFLNGNKSTGRIIVTMHMTKKGKMNILIEDNGIGKNEVNSRIKRDKRFDHLYCGGQNIGRKNVDYMETSHNKLTYRKGKTKAITQVHGNTPRFIEIDLGSGFQLLIKK